MAKLITKLSLFFVACGGYVFISLLFYRNHSKFTQKSSIGQKLRQLQTARQEPKLFQSRADAYSLPTVTMDDGTKPKMIAGDGRVQPFYYPIQPKSCERSWGVIYVASGLANFDFELRKLVRRTWAKDADRFGIRVYFFVGLPSLLDPERHKIGRKLKEESDKYHDVLQANIMDRYDRLMFKWWAQLMYHTTYCKRAEFMIWADSDAIIMLENLSAYLKVMKESLLKSANMGCVLMWGEPIRDPQNWKYYISLELWPYSQLPFYCSGPFQLISQPAARLLATEVPRVGIDYITKFLPFDVGTGIVAQSAAVKIQAIEKLYAYPPVDDVCDPELLMAHGFAPYQLIGDFWSFRDSCCQLPPASRNCTYELPAMPPPPPLAPSVQPATASSVLFKLPPLFP